MGNSILIVDDSIENINALRSILEDLYTVYIAKNGKDALDIIARLNPDLVLLDVLMPELDGFQVLERMLQNKKQAHIPVIFISAESTLSSEERGLMLGAADYIVKPYNPEIVCLKVRNQLENKKYRNKLEDLLDQRTKEIFASRQAVIMGMSLLAEGRDQSTGLHIQRVQKYTRLIAEKFHEKHPDILSKTEMERVIMLAPLHDIGKVHIADTILLKKGPLTFEEFEEMKRHTILGADVLRKTELLMKEQEGTDILHDAVFIAESHHEKFDGSGYPYGLAGEEIPISARIVSLADVYDSLTSRRTYKDKFTHERAMSIILEGDGRTSPKHFDSRVLAIFEEYRELFAAIESTL